LSHAIHPNHKRKEVDLQADILLVCALDSREHICYGLEACPMILFGIFLCASCHAYVDYAGPSREAMQREHFAAHERTMAWWRARGYL